MSGLLSKGITLSLDGEILTNLQEIPDLGGTSEAVETTTLADKAHTYIDGILNYGDSLEFKFLYEAVQFKKLAAGGSGDWVVTLPDKTTCTFSGGYSTKLDGVGVNAALTYTLAVKPSTEMVFGSAA